MALTDQRLILDAAFYLLADKRKKRVGYRPRLLAQDLLDLHGEVQGYAQALIDLCKETTEYSEDKIRTHLGCKEDAAVAEASRLQGGIDVKPHFGEVTSTQDRLKEIYVMLASALRWEIDTSKEYTLADVERAAEAACLLKQEEKTDTKEEKTDAPDDTERISVILKLGDKLFQLYPPADTDEKAVYDFIEDLQRAGTIRAVVIPKGWELRGFVE